MHSRTHREGVRNVILRSQGPLPGVAAEQLLLVLVHAGVLVEVVVVTRHHTPGRQYLVATTHGEDARDIVGRVHTIGEEARVVHLRVVLDVEMCRELQARTEVEFAPAVVNTDDRRDTPSALRAVEAPVAHPS